jgi:hypothetical protein
MTVSPPPIKQYTETLTLLNMLPKFVAKIMDDATLHTTTTTTQEEVKKNANLTPKTPPI